MSALAEPTAKTALVARLMLDTGFCECRVRDTVNRLERRGVMSWAKAKKEPRHD